MPSGGGWIHATLCLKCGQLFNNPPPHFLKYCNNCANMPLSVKCSACTQEILLGQVYIVTNKINGTLYFCPSCRINRICPSCNCVKNKVNTLCTQCGKQGMELCPHCKKWQRVFITVVGACQDCVEDWKKVAKQVAQSQTQPMYSYATASQINPIGGIYHEKESDVLTLTRDEVYTIFHKSAEEVLAFDWVIKAKEMYAPMIDMVTLAIINLVLEKLQFEVIDTKFFKEM